MRWISRRGTHTAEGLVITDFSPWVDGLTMGQVLRQTAARCGARDAVVFPQIGFRSSWTEFEAAVDRIARGLMSLGLQRGDHFGIWSTNWPQWVILQFATARIGVVLVTINPAYQPAELEFALAQSQVRGLAMIDAFRTSNFFEMLEKVCPEVKSSPPGELKSERFPSLKWIVCMRGSNHPGMMSWADLERAGQQVSDAALLERESSLDSRDPINLQYTSGTTGRPKGALLTHRNLLLNGWVSADCQHFTPDDRLCIPVPLYHCFGCVTGVICAITHGVTMIFPAESFAADLTLNAIEDERCTAIYGVPTMFIAELEHPTFPHRNTSSLRTGIMAGSPCPLELMKRVVHEMGIRQLTIGYGQTEASPLITMTRCEDSIDKRVGTIGKIIPGVEVKIIDPATGATVPDGVSGELCSRGHNIMLGYYNMPERTAEAIDADGWLHTGDFALRQPDGYFRITGRLKDLIIRGGENIAPREIEELLYQHPSVEDVQIVGVPDVKFGEEILACIKAKKGCTIDEAEIRQFCRDRLAYFKTPKYVRFLEHFPTTVTGKIQKFRLREQAIIDLGLSDAANIETA